MQTGIKVYLRSLATLEEEEKTFSGIQIRNHAVKSAMDSKSDQLVLPTVLLLPDVSYAATSSSTECRSIWIKLDLTAS